MILKNVEETLIQHNHLHKTFKLVKKNNKKTRKLSSDCEFEEEHDLPTNYYMETNTSTVVTLSENDILKIAKNSQNSKVIPKLKISIT